MLTGIVIGMAVAAFLACIVFVAMAFLQDGKARRTVDAARGRYYGDIAMFKRRKK